MRCLESILKQDYTSLEVIISDDSPNEDVKLTIQPYLNQLQIKYFYNNPPLGSPKNWNAALENASGDYLILMHQDDWFEDIHALSLYVTVFEKLNVDFVFCQNTAIDEQGNKIILQAIPGLLKTMSEQPNHLLLAQVIGPPSNTMIKKSIPLRYDENFIWLVDVDYYSRLLKAGYRYHYIPKHLVNIGLHKDQTTEFCRTHPEVIFKENILFAKKIGSSTFSDIKIYDYYWRLLRNYKIRSVGDIITNGLRENEIPKVIIHILSFQKNFSLTVLKYGAISKLSMFISYLLWKINSNKNG